MADDRIVAIRTDVDIVTVRRIGRDLSRQLGFSPTDLTLIATAISELARNLVVYARSGLIRIEVVVNGEKKGIRITATDKGPGIPDLKLAMQGGYSTSGSLGLGLPGVRRLMDSMEITSEMGKGTTVTATKWTR